MGKLGCNYENRVSNSIAQHDELEPSLQRHVNGCPECSGLVDLAQRLNQLSLADIESFQVPSAARLWWKAQLHRRRAERERALRPLGIMQPIVLVALMTALGIACFSILPEIRRALAWLISESDGTTATQGTTVFFVGVGAAALLSACAWLTLGSVVPDDS